MPLNDRIEVELINWTRDTFSVQKVPKGTQWYIFVLSNRLELLR